MQRKIMPDIVKRQTISALKPGDTVEVDISGQSRVTNTVTEETY